MEKLSAACATEVGKSYGSFTIAAADEFSYTDPETQETVDKQGLRFMAEDGSRFVFRLSGTSSTNGECTADCVSSVACTLSLSSMLMHT